MSDWLIREASAEDEEFLWDMLFYASHSNEEPGTDPIAIRSNPDLIGYIEGWKIAGRIGVIAEESSFPVGAAWLRLLGERETSNPVYVDSDIPELAIAVAPGWEGRGLGTAMFTALAPRAAERFRAIVLSARAENPAVRLYERLGFTTIAEIRNRVGTISVKMIRDL